MTLPVEEWGGAILLRELSHAEKMEAGQLAYEAFGGAKLPEGRPGTVTGSKLTRHTFSLIQFSWINEDGSQVLGKGDYTGVGGRAEPHH